MCCRNYAARSCKFVLFRPCNYLDGKSAIYIRTFCQLIIGTGLPVNIYAFTQPISSKKELMGCVFSLLISRFVLVTPELSLKHMYVLRPYLNIYDDKLLLCSLWGLVGLMLRSMNICRPRRGMSEWFHVR